MRKIFLHMLVSVDGYIEDEKKNLDWHFVDEEFERYVNEILSAIDGMIFGRKAHELLAQYWPTADRLPGASAQHLESAKWMQRLPKYVITRGGYRTDWANSHIISGDIGAGITQLKNQPGKDIALFAGAAAAKSLIQLGLVDEIRLIVNPILLGGGTPLFQDIGRRMDLELLESRRFASGAVMLRYRIVEPTRTTPPI